jgi:hypothetical protein
MARKASDLFTLLQSRGSGRGASGRSGPGILGQMTGWLLGLVGPKRRRFDGGGSRRALQFSGIALAGIVFASLGAGYLLGDAFPLGGKGPALRGPSREQPGGVAPQVLAGNGSGLERYRLTPETECKPLARQGYLLGVFGEGEAARAEASNLALRLRAEGIDSARPYRVWMKNGRQPWTVLAYYDGGAEGADGVRRKVMAAVARVPDLAQSQQVATEKKRDWPEALAVE